MTPAVLVEVGFVALAVIATRATSARRARIRRRDLFYGNTRGHDYEGHR